MSIIFMGTPEWAVPSLQAVFDSGTKISAVFSQPARPAGRKRQLTPSPLSRFAQARGLTVHTPEKAGSSETLELVRSLSPGVILVCAYGQILPQSFLDIPKNGCFNLHFSFLPRWRGASPVQAAIAYGDKSSGVSLQKMVLRLDAGPLVKSSEPEPIFADDSTPQLGSRLAEMGACLIRETLPNLLDGNFTLKKQNEAGASYCRIIKKEDGQICWHEESAVKIERKLRAYTPWPGIFAFYRSTEKAENLRRLQFTKVESVSGNFEAGKIYPELIIGTVSGGLKILRLKPEGKQEMEAEAFLRGRQQIVEMLPR